MKRQDSMTQAAAFTRRLAAGLAQGWQLAASTTR
jgi:hypothetical protein